MTTQDTSFDTQKIAIVTGANNGLGLETTKGLAREHFTVIMACRNPDKAKTAKDEVLKLYPKATLVVLPLDLSSLESVRAFAKTFTEQYSSLTLLINNAGIMIPPFEKTADGFESQMGVNYFSHFALTLLLLPTLNATQGARVVSLSSIAHKSGKLDFSNLNSEKSYSKMVAYSQSKLACLMFSFELDRKLKKSGSSVLSVAAHPGVANTNLFHHLPSIVKGIANLISPIFAHSPEEAAKPTLAAALSKDVKGGTYFGPQGFSEMKGPAGIASSSPYSHDKLIAEKLWVVSETLTHTLYPL